MPGPPGPCQRHTTDGVAGEGCPAASVGACGARPRARASAMCAPHPVDERRGVRCLASTGMVRPEQQHGSHGVIGPGQGQGQHGAAFVCGQGLLRTVEPVARLGTFVGADRHALVDGLFGGVLEPCIRLLDRQCAGRLTTIVTGGTGIDGLPRMTVLVPQQHGAHGAGTGQQAMQQRPQAALKTGLGGHRGRQFSEVAAGGNNDSLRCLPCRGRWCRGRQGAIRAEQDEASSRHALPFDRWKCEGGVGVIAAQGNQSSNRTPPSGRFCMVARPTRSALRCALATA